MDINSDERACERGSFAEGDKDGFVNLTLGVVLRSQIEQSHPTEYDYRRYEQLYDVFYVWLTIGHWRIEN